MPTPAPVRPRVFRLAAVFVWLGLFAAVPAFGQEIPQRAAYDDFAAQITAEAAAETGFVRSPDWTKPAEHYRALSTRDLAEECFRSFSFAGRLMVYTDPNLGEVELKTLHNGFAELYRRPDAWTGFLHAWVVIADKISTESDAQTIVGASVTLDALSKMPALDSSKHMVKAHEREFFDVGLMALKRYRDFLITFQDEELADEIGLDLPFFGEPCSVARFCAALAGRQDPETNAHLRKTIGRPTLSPEQDINELRAYLILAVAELEAVPSEIWATAPR